jgi:D-alanyl-D-alanine carboxypeptidase
MSVAVNLMKWNRLDVSGKQQPHPIDDPVRTFYQLAMSDSEERFVGSD